MKTSNDNLKVIVNRITRNEKRLDSLLLIINELQDIILHLKDSKKNIKLLDQYYGSKKWFKDKEIYENNQIPHIKAGVLSEDGIWNMYEDLETVICELQLLLQEFNQSKKD